jgi:SH3 domain-containing YSC84-like protein 1
VKTRVLLVVLMVGTAARSRADEKKTVDNRLQKAATVVSQTMATPEHAIPRNLLAKAVCVGVVPAEKKLAFVVGGSFGLGALVCRRNGNGPWGPPSMFALGGGSFGFQLGGESTDVVFIVMNADGAQKLVGDNVKLGADASVAGGPVGRTSAGATDVQMHAEILSYSRSRGLFAGLSLNGAVFRQDKDANRTLYGRSISAREILMTGGVGVPSSAAALDGVLAKYSPRGGQPFPKPKAAR